jgi:multidrug resistance efflux pump
VLNLQIQELQEQLNKVANHYRESAGNISKQRAEHNRVVKQLENELIAENAILARYKENVANGLTAATLEDTQKRFVSQAQGRLIKEKSVFTALDLAQLEINDNYKRQKDTALAEIARLTVKKDQISKGLQVLSPCNCVVDNVFIENGIPVVPGQSILTLSQARDSSTLMLYVPASQYRKIDEGSNIKVNVASYPSNKYGALKATVIKVSASPVPGNMIRKKGQGLHDATYFIVKATIDNVPDNVTLVTGMAVDSDIVIDETSLFDLLFDLDNKN